MSPYPIILADCHRTIPGQDPGTPSVEEPPDLEITGEAAEGFVLLNLSSNPQDQGRPCRNKVLLFSMDEEAEYLNQALSKRAEGYLIKRASTTSFRAL